MIVSHIFCMPYLYFVVAIKASFNESKYSFNESSTQAQPVLVLSNPSSTDITVQVVSMNGSAGG